MARTEERKRGARFAANTTNIDIDIVRHDFCATPICTARVIALRFSAAFVRV